MADEHSPTNEPLTDAELDGVVGGEDGSGVHKCWQHNLDEDGHDIYGKNDSPVYPGGPRCIGRFYEMR